MVGQIEGIAPEILRAKDAGFFVSLHLGESLMNKGKKDSLIVKTSAGFLMVFISIQMF